MNYNMNKMLDVILIFPQPDEADDAATKASTTYPHSSMVIRLSSKVLPAKLVETLQKKSEGMIRKLAYGAAATATGGVAAGAKDGGKPQALAVFEFIRNIMENNNLIPAWDEIPLIKEVLRVKGVAAGKG